MREGEKLSEDGHRVSIMHTRSEEPFMLTAMASLIGGTLWMWIRHDQFLEYFYSPEFLAMTHLITLGFVTSLMMGVLLRLAPMSLHVRARSVRLARVQFLLFLVGTSGMVSHFWRATWNGLAWATLLILAAALVQLFNFSAVWPLALRGDWVARHVAASLVYFVLAALLGVLLGINKGWHLEFPLLGGTFMSNLFAHIHLAAVGWVTTMIFGFELKLVPTTRGSRRFLPVRFWLLQIGTLGLVGSWLADVPWQAPFAALLLVAVIWQAWGPTRALLRGRAREWETVPLLILSATALTGLLLACGVPSPDHPLRARLQFAYGYAGLLGWIVLTITTVAFKLFPLWVWQERFQPEFGTRPVPAMRELYSRRLARASHLLLTVGVVATVVGIVSQDGSVLFVSLGLFFVGIVSFIINFVMMARWALFNLEYRG
ncbi:MAG: hypothetical protein ACE5JX_19790 [Acidobacteriota bacterium]